MDLQSETNTQKPISDSSVHHTCKLWTSNPHQTAFQLPPHLTATGRPAVFTHPPETLPPLLRTCNKHPLLRTSSASKLGFWAYLGAVEPAAPPDRRIAHRAPVRLRMSLSPDSLKLKASSSASPDLGRRPKERCGAMPRNAIGVGPTPKRSGRTIPAMINMALARTSDFSSKLKFSWPLHRTMRYEKVYRTPSVNTFRTFH